MNRYPRLFSNASLLTAAFFLSVIFCGDAAAKNLRLRSQITPTCSTQSGGTSRFADIHAEGNIAVQGSYGCRGAFIYDITNPDAPVLANWYNPGNSLQFLEAIVEGGKGYFGSGNGGGVHIVDLANPYSPVLLGVVNAANGGGYNSIHEMNVWNGYLFENLNSTSNEIIRIIDITNPSAAVLKWSLDPTPEENWVHAMHIRGTRLFTSGWGDENNRGHTGIYDISNLANQPPQLLGTVTDLTSTTAGNNMHTNWTSEDGNWLYICREIGNPDLRVYDIRNPAQPILVNRIDMGDLGLNAIAPHNPAVFGNKLYVSWYQAGVQVFDITDPANPERVAQYDTFQPAFAPPSQERSALLAADPDDLICGTDYMQNTLPTTYEGNWAVFPFLGEDKVLAGDMRNGLLILDATEVAAPPKNLVSDFDGDGRTDLSIFRPSVGDWEWESSQTSQFNKTHFGVQGDVIVPGDYDGDDRSDIAVFRPSSGVWYLERSTAGFTAQHFGLNGDVPVTADYDADGRTDLAVWRPSTGIWYIQQSTLGFKAFKWGLSTDKPVTGDFEGDGKSDIAVWRPSNGVWYILQSSSSLGLYRNFGLNGDRPLSADFDGNGVTDFAVFRPSNGIWYILDPLTGQQTNYYFGLSNDIPIPADYDGDAKADVAIFRPDTAEWYRLNSTNGASFVRTFGVTGDRPSPASVQPQ